MFQQVEALKPCFSVFFGQESVGVIYLITSFHHCSHPRCCGMRCAEEISPSKQLVLSWVTHNDITKVLNKRSNGERGEEKGDLTLGSRFHSRFTVKNNLAFRKDQKWHDKRYKSVLGFSKRIHDILLPQKIVFLRSSLWGWFCAGSVQPWSKHCFLSIVKDVDFFLLISFSSTFPLSSWIQWHFWYYFSMLNFK